MVSSKSLVMMLLASAIIFGYAYCLDILQALEVHFREAPYQFSTLEFNLMYFFTYLPIFLFNIPIGTIIDRNPITASLLALLLTSFLSQLLMTVMVQTQLAGYILVMYGMRSLFGVAGEGMFTVQSIIVTKYCKSDYEMVMSVALSLPFIFDSINSLVTTRVYDATGSMSLPWYLGSAVCLLSILAGMGILKLYVYPSKQAKPINHQSLLTQERQEGSASALQAEMPAGQQQQVEQTCNIRELRSFSSNFWVLMASTFFTEASLGSCLDNMNDLLVKRFNIPYTDAGLLLVTPYSGLALFSILFGWLIGKWPACRRPAYVVSTALYFVGQILLYLLPQTQWPEPIHYVIVTVFCLTMSLSFSIYYTGILAAVPSVVAKDSIGTAFGVIGCIVGLSQCTTPWLNIAVIDSSADLSVSYKSLNLCYVLVAFIAFLLGVYINWGPFEEMDQRYEDVENQRSESHSHIRNTPTTSSPL